MAISEIRIRFEVNEKNQKKLFEINEEIKALFVKKGFKIVENDVSDILFTLKEKGEKRNHDTYIGINK